jgi:cytochrome oxidase Cu insertion factor (SCO1/SenC/PrrC family)/thiol-disulfide isomerase/thioredoxin
MARSDSSTRNRRPETWLIWTIAGSALAVVVAIVLIVASIPSVTAAAAVVEPGIDRRTANLLELDPLTTTTIDAPSFTLTDQNAKPLSLAQFRGTPVVLSFNDDQCRDLCTLLAQDVTVANKDLGDAANKIAFVSINANPFSPSPATLRSWDRTHGLASVRNWHFGTGSRAQLLSVARRYGVPIDLDAAHRTVTHGSEIFFIDGHGRERALGQFGTESADTSLFGHALAQAADDLLPASQRTSIAGPGVPAPTTSGTELGATPSAVALPSLSGSRTLSTHDDLGRFTVVDFWSSSCSACIRGIPALEGEYRARSKTFAFLGIDVSDPGTVARAFADKYGATFPLASDSSGTVAGRFAITGLPFTVILDPHGKVVVRHPGAFTTEQLDYVLQTLAANDVGSP